MEVRFATKWLNCAHVGVGPTGPPMSDGGNRNREESVAVEQMDALILDRRKPKGIHNASGNWEDR